MRLWTTIPDEWQELVKKAMEIEGFTKVSRYIEHLIRQDLKRKKLIGGNNHE